MEWLAATEGLGEGCFWFTFNDIRSSEYGFNRLVEALFGTDAMAADVAQKQATLVEAFKKRRFILVWDNFESATGIPGTMLAARLPEPDRQRLRDFLGKLRGGASKVVITSRGPEAWLGADRCFALGLGGLQGEERWEYCATILRDLGLEADQKDAGLKTLMDLLDGHPLAMRALLPRLREVGAGVLADQLKGRIRVESQSDPLQARLFAVLEFVEDTLPAELQPLLLPLGLHERCVVTDYLELMAQQADSRFSRTDIERLLSMLTVSGLLRPLGQGFYEMHPVVTGFLRARPVVEQEAGQGDAWRWAFVDVMGGSAAATDWDELPEWRGIFHWHSINLHTALAEAEALGMDDHFAALTYALGRYAQKQRDFASADQRFLALAEHYKQRNKPKEEAYAYHWLGRIAEKRENLTAAEQWHQKSLAVWEKLGNESWMAIAYHELGIIAQERHDLATAERWHQKSLAVWEKLGIESTLMMTYAELGRIALKRHSLAAAEQWYQKWLAFGKKHGSEDEALIYDDLGAIALERREFAAAEQWYRKALAIREKYDNEVEMAHIYNQLGNIALARREFGVAEQWCRKALAISEKLGVERYTVDIYGQLGRIAQEQRDFAAAEQWYQKALAISEKHGNEHGAASTYGQLGLLAQSQGHFVESGRWTIRAIVVFTHHQDALHYLRKGVEQFLTIYRQAPPNDQAKLRQIWEEAGLGPFPEDGNLP